MRSMLAVAVAVALSGCAVMQPDRDHAAHHPPGTSESTATHAQMDKQMQSMREMHEKMMAAKTPEERRALMADHMKAMQDGMAMMGQMKPADKGSGMPMRPDMGKRMDMMEMMMQMMMDREGARVPAGK